MAKSVKGESIGRKGAGYVGTGSKKGLESPKGSKEAYFVPGGNRIVIGEAMVAKKAINKGLKVEDAIPRKGKASAEIGYIDKAVERAKAVLGTKEALRWLGTPIAALGYATPIATLGTKSGLGRVEDLLTQIEHGVW